MRLLPVKTIYGTIRVLNVDLIECVYEGTKGLEVYPIGDDEPYLIELTLEQFLYQVQEVTNDPETILKHIHRLQNPVPDLEV